MSITVKRAHWLFLEKFNKQESNTYRELYPAQIDQYLNDAQIKFISNITANKVEGTTKYSKDLSTLLVKSPTTLQPSITPTSSGTTYELKQAQLAFKCIYPVSFTLSVSKTACSNKIIPAFIEEHDDVAYKRKSSFIWNRCRAYISRETTALGSTQFDGFSVHFETDGDFTINSVYPVYYKFPREVCLGGYNDFEGTLTTASQFEFSDDAILKIIDMAVELASIAIENNTLEQKLYQTKLNN